MLKRIFTAVLLLCIAVVPHLALTGATAIPTFESDSENVSHSLHTRPCRAAVSVEFRLATAGPTRLDLYDIEGALLRSLHDDLAEPHRAYRFTLPSTSLDPGIYFLKLSHSAKDLLAKVVVMHPDDGGMQQTN